MAILEHTQQRKNLVLNLPGPRPQFLKNRSSDSALSERLPQTPEAVNEVSVKSIPGAIRSLRHPVSFPLERLPVDRHERTCPHANRSRIPRDSLLSFGAPCSSI
jgi:hypothetical protein